VARNPVTNRHDRHLRPTRCLVNRSEGKRRSLSRDVYRTVTPWSQPAVSGSFKIKDHSE